MKKKEKRKKNPPLLTPYRGEAVLFPDFPKHGRTCIPTKKVAVVKDMEEEGRSLFDFYKLINGVSPVS